jgi:hypothetical protein
LDAYIFSKQATQEAVSTLGNGVGGDGPARVVLPVIGSHRLYVAVQADDDETLSARVAAVLATPGLVGAHHYNASGPGVPFLFPTWGVVSVYVGFCLLDTQPGLSVAVHDLATAVPGVVGAAVVTGAGYSVLVEGTAEDQESLAVILNTVSGLPGVRQAATAVGAASLGYGFPETSR